MGRLMKNQWARLIVLIAATIQIGGSIQGFIWPKITWDFATNALNCLVEPFPALQVVNLTLGIIVIAWEWPLGLIAGTMYHRSIHARLAIFPICAVCASFLYQSHNAALYYVVGTFGYFLALCERETIYPEPWKRSPIDSSEPFVDCERDPQYHASKELECEPEAEEEKSSTCGSSLTQVPMNETPTPKPTTRSQFPAAHEARLLSDDGPKRPSKVDSRMRSKCWYPETVDEDTIDKI